MVLFYSHSLIYIDNIAKFGGHLGTEQMDVLRALKSHFDPNSIMNPGGTMGLDL